MDLKALKQAFGRPFKEAGFAHKAQTWYANHEEVVVVVNLQKSQYSTERFLNLGFWLKQIGAPPTMPPSEHLCHARIRAESLFQDIAIEISGLLNIESNVTDDDRTDGLMRIMSEAVIPFLRKGATAEGLRTLINGGCFRRGLVHVEAKRFLGLS